MDCQESRTDVANATNDAPFATEAGKGSGIGAKFLQAKGIPVGQVTGLLQAKESTQGVPRHVELVCFWQMMPN